MKDIYELGCEAGLLNYIDHETPRVYFIHAHADLKEFETFCKALTKKRDDEIERLRDALRPFSEAAIEMDKDDPDAPDEWDISSHSLSGEVKVGDLRRARTVIEGKE
jgi:hypothetical protein